MNKIFRALLCPFFMLSLPVLASDITVTLPTNHGFKTLVCYYAPIEKLINAKTRRDRGIVEDTVQVQGNSVTITIPDIAGGCQLGLETDKGSLVPLFYTAPGDNVNIDIVTLESGDYTLGGSSLADAINVIDSLKTVKNDETEKALASYIDRNPESESSLVAMLYLHREEYIKAFENISPSLKESVLYPIHKVKYADTRKSLEMERRQRELQSGNVKAPDFTLKNLEGIDVSLKDFKGKWVILDFWGSWCPWCIKGFPHLKESYKHYAGRLEIIGVDCKESEEAWREGVKAHELPWIQLYNPQDCDVLALYGVEVYPTKVIIDPEGTIRDYTKGEDPEFFTRLSNLMSL